MKAIHTTLRAAVGGAIGGSLVGLAEAILVVTTGAPEELWLFPFAIVSYGAFGLAAGLGLGLAYAIAAGLDWSDALPDPMAVSAAAAFAPLAFAIGRYHVVQRVFQEGIAIGSPRGAAVHVGLLAAAVVLALVLSFAVRAVGRYRSGAPVLAAGWVVVLLAAVAVASVHGGPEAKAVQRHADPALAGRPNVVLFVLDTLRVDAIERHRTSGEGGVARLARDGVRFSNAHAPSSWTRPSMASLFTSLYPSQHGATQDEVPLPVHLATEPPGPGGAGSRAGGFTTNINLAPIFNLQQGFSEYAYLEPSFYFGATDSATRLAIYKGLRVVRELLFRDRIYFQNYYQDAQVVGDAVTSWLDQNPPEPFFLLVHYMDPHDPYFEMPYNGRGVARVTDQNPDPSHAEAYHELYGEGVAYVESELGALIDELAARGFYENSVIAVTSDHGEEFQEHGGWWHGTTLYQEQLHVPLVIKPAGPGGAGRVDDRIAELVDVAPTFLAAAGIEAPRAFVGSDLFAGGDLGVAFAETDHEGNRVVALRDGDWKIIVANPDNPRGLEPVEVYDLATDPGETRNLAATDPARVQALTRRLGEVRAGLRQR